MSNGPPTSVDFLVDGTLVWPHTPRRVDWTSLIGFNRGDSDWRRFSSLFAHSYAGLLQVAPSKPIMIGEVAADEGGGSKPAWITDVLSTQLPQNFPRIKAALWFNWRTYEKNAYRNWEIESSAAAQQAFATAINSSYYAPGGTFGNLPLLTRVQPLGGTPTAPDVLDFAARPYAHRALLSWTTGTESNLLGFNVWRYRNGKGVKVNRTLIRAKRSGEPSGASYSFVDTHSRARRGLTYRLQLVNLNGQRSWYSAFAIPS